MTGSGALAAGWLLVTVTALLAAAGVFLGSTIDLRLVGGLVGGVFGIILGFVLVWRIYVIPANKEDEARDYSNINRLNDKDNDDDDSW